MTEVTRPPVSMTSSNALDTARSAGTSTSKVTSGVTTLIVLFIPVSPFVAFTKKEIRTHSGTDSQSHHEYAFAIRSFTSCAASCMATCHHTRHRHHVTPSGLYSRTSNLEENGRGEGDFNP